ncbi:HAD-IIB family hydrolase [Mycoplasmopsis ciconiae]|uniref:HAD-IIB family hydrolase n=1 Tax=Mycoplasmopsis ciconiae TaxID=561067 RepID=A0ABU7ML44_9BACT|nr:HAD-IIB family hydrolase [Mycoplasmopsis ciconiae]
MNLKNKVIASDLDGTLLTQQNLIHPFTQKMLKKAKEEFNTTNVIATGRGLQKVLPLIKEGIFDDFDYVICSNGALIYDIKNKKETLLGTVNPKVFELMKDLALKHDLVLTVDTAKYNGTFLPHKSNGELPDWLTASKVMDMNILNKYTLEEIEKIVYTPGVKITQIALRNPIDIAAKITDIVRENIKDTHSVFLTNGVYTDINPKGATKFNGLEYLLKSLNKTKDDLIAFGDSGNDVHMIEEALRGYAMGNSTQEAKDVADEIIGDHNTDAIGKTLEKLMTNSND